MPQQQLIDRYLTSDKNFIKRITKANAIKSKEVFFEILKWWRNISTSNSIGDLRQMNNNTPLIYLQLGSSSYYINADSTKAGIKEFYNNINNPWKIIINENGIKNKVTNRIDERPIEGFYMYKEL